MKNRAEESIENAKMVRSLIEDIGAVRYSKLNKILEEFPTENLFLNLTNICAREIEQIRPFLSEGMAAKLEILALRTNESEEDGFSENFTAAHEQNIDPNNL